ncbi:MAG TPA: hypothetical protein DEP51_02975 [Clostridiales bacterium]|nr:hypothetical protein [Clostridiales bacterium]
MNTVELSNACVEINEILKHSPIEFRLKCPIKIKRFFINNASSEYRWIYDKSKSLYEQNMSVTTKTLLAYLYVKYFSKSNNQRMEIKQLSQSLKLKSEIFNYDELFKKNKNQAIEENKLTIINKKEVFFVKVLKKIKALFIRKR